MLLPTAAIQVSVGFLVVWLPLILRDFRSVLARGWHAAGASVVAEFVVTSFVQVPARLSGESATMIRMAAFDTVVISALTSAGVALAIEWMAKPRLEARKERILDRSRARREIIRQFSIIVIKGASLNNADMSTLSASERRLMQAKLEEMRAEVIAAAKAIDSEFPTVALKINPQIRTVMSHAIGMTQGIAVSEKLHGQAGTEIVAVSSLALDLYYSRWWEVRKRRRLLEIAAPLLEPKASPSSAQASSRA